MLLIPRLARVLASQGPVLPTTKKFHSRRGSPCGYPLLPDLERLVEPATRGDPMRVLRWTSKSLRHLSAALHGQGHSVCPHVIADCLRELGYSLQANRKTREGSSHMDRDAQFHYINDQAKAFLAANEPVISVDTN